MKQKILQNLDIATIIYFLYFSIMIMAHCFDFNFSVTTNIVAEMINTFVWPYVILNSLTIFTNNPDIEKYFNRICLIRIVIISVLNFFYIDRVGIIESLICFLIINAIHTCLYEKGYYKIVKEQKTKYNIFKKEKLKSLENNIDTIDRYNNNEQFDFEIDYAIKTAGINLNEKLIPNNLLKEYKEFNLFFIIFIFQFICSLFLHINIFIYFIGLIVIIIGFIIVSRRFDMHKHVKKLYLNKPYYDLESIVEDLKHYLVPNDRYKYLPIILLLSITLAIIVNYSPKCVYKKVGDSYEIKYYINGIKIGNNVVIPDSFLNTPVTSIGRKAFSNMVLLKEINIPNTITYIGPLAFQNCYSLEKIELPDSITMVDEFAFYNNYSLKQVKLSNNMTAINTGTFQNCKSIETIKIPNNIKEIKYHAFYNNKELKRVEITSDTKLKSLESNAFEKCDKLDYTELKQTIEMNEKEER